MDNNTNHIDKVIREKFEAFSPSPPDYIWAGIEEGISVEPNSFFLRNRRTITISAILLFALFASIILFKPMLMGTYDKESLQNPTTEESIPLITEEDEVILNSEVVDEVSVPKDDISNSEMIDEVSDQKDEILVPIIIETEELPSSEKQLIVNGVTTLNESAIEKSSTNNVEESNLAIEQNAHTRINDDRLEIVKMKKSVFVHPEIYSNIYQPENRNLTQSTLDEILLVPNTGTSNSHWKIGYYIAPELSISDFDSVQILNSYTLSVEPTYFFNDHWFVRFGAGLSYVRDRGFAKLSYYTNEYMGSYDDVYDVTFDTVLGNIIPIYHTKTVEVWDSVRHVSISEVTNKYVYLQIPALFGYYHKKQGSDIGWYLMGGPAFNVKVGSWIDDPKPEEKDADIIDLQNNLPLRSNNYFQLWLGAGLEYEVNKKVSIAVEPGYRYYFRSIYTNPYNATSSSGFTLRVGLVYLMK